MDNKTRQMVLPMLDQEDLLMGLYFFTQDKLLSMLMEVDIEELVNVIQAAFPLQDIVMMFTEDDLSEFFQNEKLEKYDVINQLKAMPPEVIQKFVEELRRPMKIYYQELDKEKLLHQRELEIQYMQLFGENAGNNEEAS